MVKINNFYGKLWQNLLSAGKRFYRLKRRNLKKVFTLLGAWAKEPHSTSYFEDPFTGPDKYSGLVGRILNTDVWKLPVGKYKPIDCLDFPILPVEVYTKLSEDNKYLYLICCAVVTGSYITIKYNILLITIFEPKNKNN